MVLEERQFNCTADFFWYLLEKHVQNNPSAGDVQRDGECYKLYVPRLMKVGYVEIGATYHTGADAGIVYRFKVVTIGPDRIHVEAQSQWYYSPLVTYLKELLSSIDTALAQLGSKGRNLSEEPADKAKSGALPLDAPQANQDATPERPQSKPWIKREISGTPYEFGIKVDEYAWELATERGTNRVLFVTSGQIKPDDKRVIVLLGSPEYGHTTVGEIVARAKPDNRVVLTLWGDESERSPMMSLFEMIWTELEREGGWIVAGKPQEHDSEGVMLRSRGDATKTAEKSGYLTDDDKAHRREIVARAKQLKKDCPTKTWKAIALELKIPERTLRDWRHNPIYE